MQNKRKEIIDSLKINSKDVGSSEVQIGLLSEKIKENVKKARLIQKERFKNEKILTNSEMNISQVEKFCPLDEKEKSLLKNYLDKGLLTARGYHRVLKVARTIADLDESEKIKASHLQEALVFRTNYF